MAQFKIFLLLVFTILLCCCLKPNVGSDLGDAFSRFDDTRFGKRAWGTNSRYGRSGDNRWKSKPETHSLANLFKNGNNYRNDIVCF